jgi:hypothetical protein
LASDISNGAGNATWPLAYTVFLTAMQSKQAKDCGPAEGLMRFLSWAQTNDRAATTINGQGWGALAIVYKRALINSFGTVKCNNATALTTAYIIGMGGTIRAVDDWAVAYTSNTFAEKYYVYDTPTTINQMIAGTHSCESRCVDRFRGQLTRESCCARAGAQARSTLER